jgi:D-alanine--poly(phosphoribitol) ligase subunit 1
VQNFRVLAELLQDAFTKYQQLPALKIENQEICYAELWQKSAALANALHSLGAANTAIGIVGQRKLSSYLGVLGTLISGAFYTPLNPKYNKAKLAAIIKDAQIKILVGDAEELNALGSILNDPRLDGFDAVFCPDSESTENKGWLGKEIIDQVTGECLPQVKEPGDLVYLLYTSGSTGRPKGVQVSNHNIISFLASMEDNYDLKPGFRASQTFDLSFDPSVSDMFFTWLKGGVLCVLPEREVMLPVDYINRERITFWNAVPTVASFMHKMGFLTPNCFPHITHSMFCGEQFPKHIADAWRAAAPASSIENLYGPTETTIYISRYVYEKESQRSQFRNRIIPIGRPFLNHECNIVGDDGVPAVNGEVGEIVFKGPQVTQGYLHDKERTDAVFVRFQWDEKGDTWYRTGDLGFVNETGQVECIGRKDSQIKLAGRRIEIGEIEAVLNSFEKLSDAIVVPVFDENNVVSYCVAFTQHLLTDEDEKIIRKESVSFLDRVFFPKKIFTLSSIPTIQSGKVDRKALTAMAAAKIAATS